jgi:phosphate transport system permease protein
MTESSSPSEKPTFRRSHATRSSVIWADRLATWVIAIGGIGTIAAVMLVFVFLAWVVVPLFVGESLDARNQVRVTTTEPTAAPLATGVDEYLTIGWAFLPDHSFQAFRMDTGEILSTSTPFQDKPPTCWSFSISDGQMIFGFADGTVQLGTIDYASQFLSEADVPAEIRQTLSSGEFATLGDGIIERTPEGQFRKQVLSIEFKDPVDVKPGIAIEAVDRSQSSRNEMFTAYTADHELFVVIGTTTKNILTGKETTRYRRGSVTVESPPQGEAPSHIGLAGLGEAVLLVWSEGTMRRYEARNVSRIRFAEEKKILDGEGQITTVAFLLGKSSLAVGDSLGHLGVWFSTKPEDATTFDGVIWVEAHSFSFEPGNAITALAPSPRSRNIGVGFADGTVQLVNVTAGNRVATVSWPASQSTTAEASTAIDSLVIAPKDDVLLATSGGQVATWTISAPHPEISLVSLFTPIHYEGYNEPESVWQSSSGTDDFEPKYGLLPLIFGTLKATFYCMLFGAPLAILAAIYTSEFLHPRAKAVVKPTIEIMASLPSVVLGFLAALVFAPWVERFVPELLMCIVLVPLTLMLGAQLWQLIPSHFVRSGRLVAMVVALFIGLGASFQTGWIIEQMFFSGDMKAWLDGQAGDGVGGWMLVLVPASALLVMATYGPASASTIRPVAARTSRFRFGLLDLLRFVFGVFLTLTIAYSVAALLTYGVGWDPRGWYVDTYVQRNAFVVGFAMGFAIIPIIYTISEDALSAVPESLRGGSLATGATKWQTAMRVVVPTAMSGIFSALMIGLGRAVGETMIVLMAAGNTPVMDWNIFNGFRTLSANIAVELPEAVQNSTHYRVLFLAALVLFIMTFVVNTVAEIIRMRFRKRAFQL